MPAQKFSNAALKPDLDLISNIQLQLLLDACVPLLGSIEQSV